jgi:hypothetical protein
LLADLPDTHCVTRLKDQRLHICIVEQVHELVGFIPIIDVDRAATNLKHAVLGFDVFIGVVQIDANLRVCTQTVRLQQARYPCGTIIVLAPGCRFIATDKRRPLRNNVGYRFPNRCKM